MKIFRRTTERAFCALTVGLLALLSAVHAQDYPTRPVRLIVPSPPGGGTDITARLIAPKLSAYLGQQIVVDNRGGANGNIGSEIAAKAPGDGYTLLMGISTLTTNPYLMAKTGFDVVRDLAPISLVAVVPNVLVSHPSFPARTIAELVAYAKSRPGQINYASSGIGSTQHLGMELFLSASGLKMVHVAYKGVGPGLVDVVAGHLPLMMPNVLSALPHIKSGKLRAYGVTSLKHSSIAPDLPTLAETGVPNYEVVPWFGLLAPASTPHDIIVKLHAGTVRSVQDPATRAQFINNGAEPVGGTPEEFATVIRSDLARWGKVLKETGIKPE